MWKIGWLLIWVLGCSGAAEQVVVPEDSAAPEEEPEAPLDELVIDGDYIEVEGLMALKVSCELEEADGFAVVEVIAALSEIKPAADACAPEGLAFGLEIRWTDEGGDLNFAGVEEEQAACLASALSEAQAPYQGSCEMALLVGEPEGALKSAKTLGLLLP